jgi:8-oxo-dGTP pyrophosphatase MutT (NUDIX family)
MTAPPNQTRPRSQFAALPWRDGPEGREVLLITTRGGGRWLVPKGKPMPGLNAAEAAAQEAWEEAGVRGIIEAVPIGAFGHRKGPILAPRRLHVELYALQVTSEAAEWPESHERERRWVSVPTALRLVRSQELRRLIAEFCAFRPTRRMRLAAMLHRLAATPARLRR